MATPTATPVWRQLLPPVLLALILWSTFVLKLYNLEHTGLTRWDEVFHAIVAQNVMKHPLKPTLVDVPYLPYDHKKWGENHVWLHKPILPFWQIALSFAVLGVHPFALRFPSALLSTGAAWLTYLIGKELFDRRTGLIAATLQAINPFVMSLIHGYQFADHVDVSLLFWVEAAVFFLLWALRTGHWRYLILAGVAQGLAYLSKSYLAGIVFGVALTAWLLPIARLCKRAECRIGIVQLMVLLGTSIAVVAPWAAYCAIHYPDEFWHEEMQIWRHLGTNVEGWAAPWDRVVFDYLVGMHGVFYTPILVAMLAFLGKAVAERHRGLWLCYAWSAGVMVPHLLATSKTPSATLIAMPALLLLLGLLIAGASRLKSWPLMVLTVVLALSLIFPAVVRRPGYGYPFPRDFGTIMFQAKWVLYHVGGTFLLAGITALVSVLVRRRWPAANSTIFVRGLRGAALLFCFGVLAWLTVRTFSAAWQVVDAGGDDSVSVEVGTFARTQLPENAVLLCEQPKGYEHLTIMFYADRTCYPFPWRGPDELARQINEAGGVPYLVTRQRLTLPVLHVCKQGPTIYRWQPMDR